MAQTSLNREWHIAVSSANFGVKEGPLRPAVQFAQEGLRSWDCAPPLFLVVPYSNTARNETKNESQTRNSPAGSKVKSGTWSSELVATAFEDFAGT